MFEQGNNSAQQLGDKTCYYLKFFQNHLLLNAYLVKWNTTPFLDDMESVFNSLDNWGDLNLLYLLN